MRGVDVVAGGHSILAGIDLDIEPGTRAAVVGASGAGKSTLVGVLLGWHRPAAGEIRIDGRPLCEEDLAELRRQTAWVDPAVRLWNRSLLDNLLYGADQASPSALAEVLECAGLHELVDRLPDRLDTPLGEAGGRVSGGEAQSIRFGRALMRRDARLVVLDEPFRGLDLDRRRVFMARASAWWRGATLLCIVHDVRDTTDFDQVILLEGGRVRERGAPSALGARASAYRDLLDADVRVQTEIWQRAGWQRVLLSARAPSPSRIP
jgi:ATP-binding cassette subfamily B protein